MNLCHLVPKHLIAHISFQGISPVFVSVWLAEIITLVALLLGGYYLYRKNGTLQGVVET